MFSTAESGRRKRLEQSRQQKERDELVSRAASVPSAKEQLYENYISGDFMFSSCYVNYTDILESHRSNGKGSEPSSATACVHPTRSVSSPIRHVYDDQPDQSQMDDFRSSSSETRGSMQDRELDRPVNMSATFSSRDSFQKRQHSSNSGGSSAVRADSSSVDRSSIQSTVTSVPNNTQKRSMFWPFRKSSVVS